jgi:hypothetical protein
VNDLIVFRRENQCHDCAPPANRCYFSPAGAGTS